MLEDKVLRNSYSDQMSTSINQWRPVSYTGSMNGSSSRPHSYPDGKSVDGPTPILGYPIPDDYRLRPRALRSSNGSGSMSQIREEPKERHDANEWKVIKLEQALKEARGEAGDCRQKVRELLGELGLAREELEAHHSLCDSLRSRNKVLEEQARGCTCSKGPPAPRPDAVVADANKRGGDASRVEELAREVARLKEDGKLKDEVIALLKSDIKGVRSESNFEVVEARRELGEAREGERRAKLEVEQLSRAASKAAAWVTELERQAEALGRAQIGLGERAGVDARMRRRHLEEMRAMEKDCSDLASERDALSQKVFPHERRVEELEISLRAEKNALARAGREITEGVEERSKMRVQMRRLNIELDDMRLQLEEARYSGLPKEDATSLATLRTEFKRVAVENDVLHKQLADARGKGKSDETVAGLRKEIEVLHGEKDALYVEVQGLRKGMGAGGWEEASALRVQVRKLELELTELRTLRDDAARAAESRGSEAASIHHENARLRQEVAEIGGENERLVRCVDDLKNELDVVSAGLRDAGSKKKACDECVRLRVDNTAAREACEEMKSEVERLGRMVDLQKTELTAVKSELVDADERLNRMRGSKAEEIEALRQELHDVKETAVLEAEALVKANQDENQTLQELIIFRSEYKEMEAQLAMVSEGWEQTRAELDEARRGWMEALEGGG